MPLRDTSYILSYMSTLLPEYTVVDLLWNLMIDLFRFTVTFLSRNLLRNLSCSLLARFMVYMAIFRNIDRVAFLFRHIPSIPSDNFMAHPVILV